MRARARGSNIIALQVDLSTVVVLIVVSDLMLIASWLKCQQVIKDIACPIAIAKLQNTTEAPCYIAGAFPAWAVLCCNSVAYCAKHQLSSCNSGFCQSLPNHELCTSVDNLQYVSKHHIPRSPRAENQANIGKESTSRQIFAMIAHPYTAP